MKDTLNFVGDGDDLDVIHDVERTFGIKLTDAEAERVQTVGQLYDSIELKRPNAGSRTPACLSQIAFYCLRRAFTTMGLEDEITPQTPISVLDQIEPRSISKKWRRLAQSSGLDLPRLETPFRTPERWPSIFDWLTRFALAALVCVWATLGIFLGEPRVLLLGVVATAALCIGLNVWWWLIFRTVPRRILTVGELAREAAGCSFTKLTAENKGSASSDRWFTLVAILRHITGQETAITRETTFFARHAGHIWVIAQQTFLSPCPEERALPSRELRH